MPIRIRERALLKRSANFYTTPFSPSLFVLPPHEQSTILIAGLLRVDKVAEQEKERETKNTKWQSEIFRGCTVGIVIVPSVKNPRWLRRIEALATALG